MKIEVLITAQIYENKAFYEGEESWALKGKCHFKVEVENFWLMYSEEEDVDEKFAEIVSNQSSAAERFQYVDYEILWHGIETIDGVIA